MICSVDSPHGPEENKAMKIDVAATSLADRIAEFTAGMAKAVPQEVVAVLGAELKKLAESGIAKNAVHAGAKAPLFSLPDAKGKNVSLSTVLAKGPVGAELVAISPQTSDYALSDVEQKRLTFPVLSDLRNSVARQYGLVYRLSDALKRLQEDFKNPIPKFNGDDSWELPMPGTFLIDRGGTVRLAHVDPNYMKRLEPAAILDALHKIG
jgi:peroxiredoxin